MFINKTTNNKILVYAFEILNKFKNLEFNFKYKYNNTFINQRLS